ncbi:MAG: DUF933 domain-containing protein [Pseudomonadota bacterium]
MEGALAMITLGIIGLEQSGKKTIFSALTSGQHGKGPAQQRGANQVAVVSVPDPRIDILNKMYNPKKTAYAQVEYLLPAFNVKKEGSENESETWKSARTCDAIIHVVRNFSHPVLGDPESEKDFKALETELAITDLMIVEKRIERIEAERKRGRKGNEEEYSLLQSCKEALEAEKSLRDFSSLANHALLKGFAFLSAKPRLIVFNNADEDNQTPAWATSEHVCLNALVVRGRIEMELAGMTPEDASEFTSEYGISVSALDRVIQSSYDALGLISFFTVGEDEVKAWPIQRGTVALDAAAEVHSDIKKGFIRAEVVGYEDIIKAGSLQEARKQGTFRLEGKLYKVNDGDIVHFRFSV